MKFKADIDVMPLEALLDPQGKAVGSAMKNLGLSEITNVRIGKHIRLLIDAPNEKSATEKAQDACKKLLVNEIMEGYSMTIQRVK